MGVTSAFKSIHLSPDLSAQFSSLVAEMKIKHPAHQEN